MPAERTETRWEYVVLHAPGWPGGLKPVPNTEGRAREFAQEHGGVAKRRLVSDWVALPEPNGVDRG